MEREEWLDQLKGFTIFLVVYGHCIQYLGLSGTFWNNRIFQIIYSFHMSLFMMISGYLFYPFAKKYGFRKGIARKVKTILCPCLVWGGVIYVVALFRRETGIGIRGLFLCEIWHNWFLWAVFFCTIALLLCLRVKNYYLLLSFLIIISGFGYPDYGNLIGFKMMFPAFLAGYILNDKDIVKAICEQKHSVQWLILAAVSLLYIILMLNVITVDDIGAWKYYDLENAAEYRKLLMRWIINLVGSFVFFLGFAVLSGKIKYTARLFRSLGKDTLGIYMVHLFFFEWIRPTMLIVGDNWNPMEQNIYFFVMGIVVTLISDYLVELIRRNRMLSKYLLGIGWE